MRRFLAFIVVCGACVITPDPAAAEGYVTPFIGFDYGGDSGCQRASNCDDKNSNFGIAGGKIGGIAGLEAELGYARDFFGETPGVESSVLTLMTNVIVGPRIGPIRLFVLGGVGLIKAHVDFTAGSLLDSNNNFGWNIGGGTMIMFGRHIGVRGDVRRFKSFQDADLPASLTSGNPLSPFFAALSNEKLTFNRASAGLILAF